MILLSVLTCCLLSLSCGSEWPLPCRVVLDSITMPDSVGAGSRHPVVIGGRHGHDPLADCAAVSVTVLATEGELSYSGPHDPAEPAGGQLLRVPWPIGTGELSWTAPAQPTGDVVKIIVSEQNTLRHSIRVVAAGS